MTDRVREAAALMQRALDLLDEAGESLAALRLQHAIDTIGGRRLPDGAASLAEDERRA